VELISKASGILLSEFKQPILLSTEAVDKLVDKICKNSESWHEIRASVKMSKKQPHCNLLIFMVIFGLSIDEVKKFEF